MFTKADLLGISLAEYCQRQDITVKDLIYKKQNDLHILNDHYHKLASQSVLSAYDISLVVAINEERDKVRAKLKEYREVEDD